MLYYYIVILLYYYIIILLYYYIIILLYCYIIIIILLLLYKYYYFLFYFLKFHSFGPVRRPPDKNDKWRVYFKNNVINVHTTENLFQGST